MASEKKITMREYNGTDYDTLYPKTIAEQVDGVYSQTETDTLLSHKASWSQNNITGSVLDWAKSQTIPTSGYTNMDVTDVPYSSYWLVNVLMSNVNSNWKVVLLYGITSPVEVWYRVYNFGNWNTKWKKLLNDSLTPSEIGAYTKTETDALLAKKRLYFVSGLLLDANGDATEGVGTATINVDTNGIAQIDFSIKITHGFSAVTFDFGINPALFTAKNANIPTITPVDGGQLVILDANKQYAAINDYGGTFQTDLGRWRPSRMYNTEGGIGGFQSSNMNTGMILTGTCYGTVNS